MQYWYQNNCVEKQSDADKINALSTISHLVFNRHSGLTGLLTSGGWNYFTVFFPDNICRGHFLGIIFKRKIRNIRRMSNLPQKFTILG